MTLRNLSLLALAVFFFLALSPASAAKPKAKPPVVRYEIHGQIDGLENNHRATVRMTGRETRSATTRTDGTFTFKSVKPGSYTLRPQRAGRRFSPTFRTVAVRNHDVTGVSFTAHRLPPKKR